MQFKKWQLTTGLILLPTTLFANPTVVDPISALGGLFFETLYFSLILRFLGFRSYLVFPLWLIATTLTWSILIGMPLGALVAMLSEKGITEKNGGLIFLAGAVIMELAVCFIESKLIMFATEFKLFCRREQAAAAASFPLVLKLTLIGNMVSVAAGLIEVTKSDYSIIGLLAILPAYLFARLIIKAAEKTEKTGASEVKETKSEAPDINQINQ